jgi:hypothetical protein
MSPLEIMQKADTSLADLINGAGMMQPEQAGRFLRLVMDEPTILNKARVVAMKRPKMEISKVGFTSRLLRPANQGVISGPRAGDEGPRALLRSQRAMPTLERLTLETVEYIAELDLPYEVLEDNIEGGAIDGTQFQQTLLEEMAKRIALDLEELLILGDTASGDTYLATQDGILKQTVSNIVNHAGQVVNPNLFGNMVKALPNKYHRLLNRMQYFVAKTKEIDYRMQVANRQTQLGDALLTGQSPVAVLGVPMTSASVMPASSAILTDPRNIIWGVQRDIRMEFDRDTRERSIFVVVSLRIATKFEQEDMVVKAINIG